MTYLVHPLKGVAAVAVLVDPTIRGAVVREKHQTSMVSLGRVGQQIEGRVVIK